MQAVALPLPDRRSNDRGALGRHSASRIFSKEQPAALAGKPRAGGRCAFWAWRRPLSATEIIPEACAADSRASRRVHGRQRTSQFHDDFVPTAVPPALSTALATE